MAPSKRKNGGGYSVSGPGVDKTGYESGPVGLSAAINLAKGIGEGEALYVRNSAGDIFGRVECVSAKGDLHVYGNGGRS